MENRRMTELQQDQDALSEHDSCENAMSEHGFGENAMSEHGLGENSMSEQDFDENAMSEDDFDVEDPQLWKPFPPSWIETKWWGMLCDLWSNEDIKKVSAQNSKNQREGGGVHHTCGSRSVAMHKQTMVIENGGEDVDDIDVFERTHRHAKGKGQYANKKAEQLVEVYNERVEKGDSNQVDKQRVWVQLTRGRKRGRYYGLPGIIDRDQIDSASAPSCNILNSGTQSLYTHQQVQDIVNVAVTNAVNNVHQELGTRVQWLEQTMNMPSTGPHSHVANGPSHSSVVPEFLEALTMNGHNTVEEQQGQSGRTHERDNLWHF